MSREPYPRQCLKEAIAAVLVPRLIELGFTPKGSATRKKTGTATQYWRERDDRYDFLRVYLRMYQRPYFFLEFDSLPKSALPNDFGPADVKFWEDYVLRYRLARCAFPERWFGLGLIVRYLAPRLFARRATRLARNRLTKMEKFLRDGRKSRYVWGGRVEDIWAKPEYLDQFVLPWS